MDYSNNYRCDHTGCGNATSPNRLPFYMEYCSPSYHVCGEDRLVADCLAHIPSDYADTNGPICTYRQGVNSEGEWISKCPDSPSRIYPYNTRDSLNRFDVGVVYIRYRNTGKDFKEVSTLQLIAESMVKGCFLVGICRRKKMLI